MARPSTSAIRTLAAGAIAGGGLVAATAMFAGAVTTSIARRVVIPPTRRQEDTIVLSVDEAAGRIRFGATLDSVLPGLYSFWFDGGRGHARIGDVVERSGGTVTRQILGVDFGNLADAKQGRFNGWLYLAPAELGVPYEDVRFQTTLGVVPAWLVPAASSDDADESADDHAVHELDAVHERWAILIHGRATVRQEVLRAVPVFREAGYSSLLISYRNDGEAPNSADHRYALGDTEWLDVESAILFALDRGAREIVLMGWSMGGAIALQTATRSRVASVITGVVLESPVISWTETLMFQGEALRLPAPVKRGVLSMISHRWGGVLTGQDEPIDLGRLDFVARSGDLDVPVLVLHSDDDGYAPSGGSRRLAEERPDIVRLVPFTVARHTRLWNYDRDRWNSAIRAWLDSDAAALDAAGAAPLPESSGAESTTPDAPRAGGDQSAAITPGALGATDPNPQRA